MSSKTVLPWCCLPAHYRYTISSACLIQSKNVEKYCRNYLWILFVVIMCINSFYIHVFLLVNGICVYLAKYTTSQINQFMRVNAVHKRYERII